MQNEPLVDELESLLICDRKEKLGIHRMEKQKIPCPFIIANTTV